MFQAAITDQFKLDILKGVHQPGDNYKVALFLKAAAADKNQSSVSYTATGELPSANGYKQGGLSLSGYKAENSGGKACIYWSDAIWPNASFTADAAVIYNASRGNKVLAVLAFPPTTATNGPFTLSTDSVICIP